MILLHKSIPATQQNYSRMWYDHMEKQNKPLFKIKQAQKTIRKVWGFLPSTGKWWHGHFTADLNFRIIGWRNIEEGMDELKKLIDKWKIWLFSEANPYQVWWGYLSSEALRPWTGNSIFLSFRFLSQNKETGWLLRSLPLLSSRISGLFLIQICNNLPQHKNLDWSAVQRQLMDSLNKFPEYILKMPTAICCF